MVWGFRIAFVTFGCKGMTDEQYDALDKKMLGMIRATVSNCDHPGQTLLVHAMQNSRYQADKDAVFSEMEERYRTLKESLRSYVDKYDLLKPYPFNSGYFMAFSCKGSAEALRKHLLDDYHIGCINIADRTLRLAYCSVPRADTRTRQAGVSGGGRTMELKSKLYLIDEEGEKFMGIGVLWLLQKIASEKSLRKAAADLGISYSKAYMMIRNLEASLGVPVVNRQKGGADRSGATLTVLENDSPNCTVRFRRMPRKGLKRHMKASRRRLPG